MGRHRSDGRWVSSLEVDEFSVSPTCLLGPSTGFGSRGLKGGSRSDCSKKGRQRRTVRSGARIKDGVTIKEVRCIVHSGLPRPSECAGFPCYCRPKSRHQLSDLLKSDLKCMVGVVLLPSSGVDPRPSIQPTAVVVQVDDSQV